MKPLSKILFWGILGFALMQLIPVDRTNKPVDQKKDFVKLFNTPPHIREILKTSCYDCHSNETVYPSYAYVAPVSWAVKNHVNEGREHLNFSEWGGFNQDLKKNMLEHAVEAVRDGSMPMGGYVAQHPEANLSAAQRKVLADYFESILLSGKF